MSDADRSALDKGKRSAPTEATEADLSSELPEEGLPSRMYDERPVAPAQNPGYDWPGRYEFVEGARGTAYVWTYSLVLNEALTGTLDVDGPQVTTRYAVEGEVTRQGLRVILTGFRPENLSTLVEPGQVLFELREGPAGDQGDELGDRTIWTHWRAMTATGVEGNEAVQIAFYPAG